MAGDAEKRRNGRILVVEDNPDIREALVAILEMKGYDAISAENGSEALDWLADDELFDLIILDLSMPVMDGRQFRSEQLKDPRIKHIPVVIVSALSDHVDLDADKVMIKPVDVEVLLTTITDILRAHKRGRPD